ncbi:membrane protein [Arthrobacter phage Atuin]|nr:membrane protein [Arthrobacter phage Atuin]
MKKFFASILSLALLLIGSVFLAAPAQAGEVDAKVDICHANNGSKGFTANNVNISSIVDLKTGKPEGHGLDERDVIPSFSWVQDKVRHYYDGKNLASLGYILGTGCKENAVGVSVTPNLPTYTPPSCVLTDWKKNPYGTVNIPENLGEGVEKVTFGPSLNTDVKDAPTWTVHYGLKPNDEDFVYSWAEGENGKFTINATHISSDPLWVVDSKTGEGSCETANTGASPALTTGLWIGGGLAILGLLFFLAPKLARRKS